MQRTSFSVIELVFVIVILGVLTAVAVPRLSLGREDACYAKLRTTLSEVETILSREYTKKFLQGKSFTDTEKTTLMTDSFKANNSDGCTFEVLNNAQSVRATIGRKTLTMDVTTNTTTKSPTITCDYGDEMCRRLTGKQKDN